MDAQTLDTEAVARWLETHMDGFQGPVTATKFNVGQSNPTFRLEGPLGAYVLRRKPPGQLLKSAHAVDREFRVQSALAGTDVPVARMHVLCEDPAVIGSDFYVMEAVQGRNIDDPRVPEARDNAERAAIYGEMCRVLAAIHEVDIEAVGLADYGPPGNYFERQISRWTKQYRASETESVADMDALIDWLPDNIPDDDQRRLVHGDYRIDNMLFQTDGPGCVAVLDWELSTIGHPYADLASLIMQWQMPTGAEGRGLAGVDRAALGIPSDEAFIEMYCRARGIAEIPGMNFYVAFAFFRMAAIIQGVFKRALDGNASNPERAMRLGKAVPRFAAGGLGAAHG